MMNPIFSRRYKGSRPNIMATTSKRPNYTKSVSTAGASLILGESSSSSCSSFAHDSSSTEDTVSPTDLKTPEDAFSSMKLSKHERVNTDSSTTRFLAQELLASKQNMLAQVNLTHQENTQRSKLERTSKPEYRKRNELLKMSKMKQSFSTENFSKTFDVQNPMIQKSPTVHNIGNDIQLCDFDDDDDEFNNHRPVVVQPTVTHFVSNSRISRPNLNQRISKTPLDGVQWRDLKRIVLGTGNFHDGWVSQGFHFDSVVPFGLVQKKGGPCGVLAVLQSLIIRNLVFGSPFGSEKCKSMRLQNLQNFDEFVMKANETVGESIRERRIEALVQAVTEIIWNCGKSQQHTHETNRKSLIMFSDFRIQPEVICILGKIELEHFINTSIHRIDCISLVYSAVLTRGIQTVKEDMDFENCSLIGLHGYCSQELVNLLAIGRAISNTFDNEISLDGKVLKGIPGKCDVGLLSLFEHYDSLKVGSFLKSPNFPVWIICSESHFSVIFSTDERVCEDEYRKPFDLYYYDGLARQENIIRLTIHLNCGDQTREPPSQNRFSHLSISKDDDLVPPLEKCIRTKWPGATVDWNDTEPIL